MTAAVVFSAGPALADTAILKYDKQGRVISTDNVETKARRGGPDSAPAAGRGSDERALSTVTRRSLGEPVEMTTAPNRSDRFERGEVVVLGQTEAIEDQAKSLGFTVIERTPLDDLGLYAVRFKIPQGMSERGAVNILDSSFPGLVADVNGLFDLAQGPTDKTDFALRMVGWGRVPPTCGRGVRIGMIDTYPDIKHPMLQGQKVIAFNFIGANRKIARSDHGTAIAGIFVGKPYRGSPGGLLPGAQLFAANIFERRKDGKPRGNLLAFLKAINWLAKSKVGVVNLSIAGSKNKVLTTVATKSIKNGLILVAAAGNAGPGAKPAYPAAYNQVVSVTALDGRGKVYRHANRGRYIDFAAPGVAVWTAGKGGGKLQSGTSFAVPFITSLVALLIHGGHKPDPDVIRSRLRRYVKDLGKPGKDSDYGLGMVRVRPPC